ncbi:MAG: hypothetical protein DHS20C08_05800 [Rhodomicrobium sp.]|nr:MAG: hypothetical protein DHS20C08_05800 [Rhodomicrobium sp.]
MTEKFELKTSFYHNGHLAGVPVFCAVLICSILFAMFMNAQSVQAKNNHSIRVLVEDSPITNFQISQRANLMMMSSPEVSKRLKAKLKSKSTQKRWRAFVTKKRPQSKAEAQKLQKIFVRRLQNEARAGVAASVKKKVLDELINERLMIAEAKKNNIVVSKQMVNQQIERIAVRNSKGKDTKTATKLFFKSLASRGVGAATFRDKLRATIAWQQVVRAKFGREVNFGDRDVERQLGLDSNAARDRKVQLSLQQIIITFPGKYDEAAVVKQYVEADSIRKRFTGCANMRSLIAPYKSAKVINLGKKTIDQMPSPINLILSDMKAGQITPPQPSSKGLEMYAVCDRKQVSIDDTKRTKVLGELRQKAFQMRAARYLKDVRADAHIEYRD